MIQTTHRRFKLKLKTDCWYVFTDMADNGTFDALAITDEILCTSNPAGVYEGCRFAVGNPRFHFGQRYTYKVFFCVPDPLGSVDTKLEALQKIRDYVSDKKDNSIFYGFNLVKTIGTSITPCVCSVQNYAIGGYWDFVKIHKDQLKTLRWLNV